MGIILFSKDFLNLETFMKTIDVDWLDGGLNIFTYFLVLRILGRILLTLFNLRFSQYFFFIKAKQLNGV